MRLSQASVLTVLLLVVSQPMVLAGDADPEEPVVAAPCTVPEQFRFIAGTGMGCLVDETWNVLLRDGTILSTHGPDPEGRDGPGGHDPATVQVEQTTWREPSRSATCVDDPTTQHHGRILVTYPTDRPKDVEQLEAAVRSMFYLSNGFVRGAAEGFGYATSFRMHCSAPGVPSVTAVELPTVYYQDSFGSIVDDLRDQGFTDPLAKYWILHTDRVPCGCSGMANIHWDDSDHMENMNHAGPSYAVTFQALDMLTFLHEATHNLGGVQMSAPNTSGGWHCNDGYDIMCYADGGRDSEYTTGRCPTRYVYDCGADDYFHPDPPTGSYLERRWNVANATRYLDRVLLADLPSEPRDLFAAPTTADRVVLTWDPPASDGGAPIEAYALYRGLCAVRAPDTGDLPTFIRMLPSSLSTIDVPPGPGSWVYQVAAVTANGEGALSAYAYAVVPGEPTSAHLGCVIGNAI